MALTREVTLFDPKRAKARVYLLPVLPKIPVIVLNKLRGKRWQRPRSKKLICCPSSGMSIMEDVAY